MWRLWQRMTEIFGHRWVSSFGDEPNESWCRCLADVTPEQIGQGLNALIRDNDEWPPTAIQFRNLCTGHDPFAWERQCHRIVDTRTLLPQKRSEEQTRDCLSRISQIKTMLKD